MGAGTEISWADNTWPMVTGCTAVSDGCDNCWAAREASGRLKHLPEYEGLASGGAFNGRVRLLPERLAWPLRWRGSKRIFACSSADLFHRAVPDEFVARVLAVMALAPNHTFLVATKRHGRMRSLLADAGMEQAVLDAALEMALDPGMPLGKAKRHFVLTSEAPMFAWPLPNLHLGVSVENQPTAWLRIPDLLRTPAAVRWVSYEPALGPVQMRRLEVRGGGVLDALAGLVYDPGERTVGVGERLDWVVAGGESGAKARPAHPDWFRKVRDDCADTGVPFHFKQWGEHLPADVVDNDQLDGARGFLHPTGGYWQAPRIRRPGPTGTMRSAEYGPMRPGDATKGGLVMLDDDTVAVRVGKGRAGHLLDGAAIQQYPRQP